MEDKKENTGSQPCGPECSCNSPKGMSLRSKAVLFAMIIIVAGAVLGNSLIKRSRSAATVPKPGYSTALSLKTSSSGAQQGPASETKPAMQNVYFAPLASLASLDTVARDMMGGVFILLVNNDTEKTPAMLQEIAAATKTIASRGTRMGTFQLAGAAPDFAAITAQMPAPGVLVAVKGRGMRGVQGSDITETKLLQAWLAAMQPSSCCSAGGNHVCK